MTPQKWGVIFVLQMCKNLLIRLAVKRSKGSILYNISKFTADTGTYRLCADKVVCKRVYEVERILLN